MSNEWQYQLRIYMAEALAGIARRDPDDPAIKPLAEILNRHSAALQCQYDAFAEYVAEAERYGTENYPLYEWTRNTIDDPAKKAKYTRSFSLCVDGDEVYAKDKADRLEAGLQPLIGSGLVERMTKHDTNPANNPQPPERYRR